MTQALSDKQKGHIRANSTIFLNFYTQNIWGIKWAGNGGRDKQKLQVKQERVWPFSPKISRDRQQKHWQNSNGEIMNKPKP